MRNKLITAFPDQMRFPLTIVKYIIRCKQHIRLWEYYIPPHAHSHDQSTCGIPTEEFVCSGVAKTEHAMAFAAETAFAVERGIVQLNMQSERTLSHPNGVACRLGRVAASAVAITPDVESKNHANTVTRDGKINLARPGKSPRHLCRGRHAA